MQESFLRRNSLDRQDEEEEEDGEDHEALRSACHNSVVPGKNSKFIQPSDQIPPRSGIPSYEYAQSNN